MIICGNCKRRHSAVADVHACHFPAHFADEYEEDGAAAAEMAYERYLEDCGSNEAYLQEQAEAAWGVISFSDAWDMACPERVAEREAERAAD